MLTLKPIHHCLLALSLWSIAQNSTLGVTLRVQFRIPCSDCEFGSIDITSKGLPHDPMQLLVDPLNGEVFLKGPLGPAAVDYGAIILYGPSEFLLIENAIQTSIAAEPTSSVFSLDEDFELAIWTLQRPNPSSLFNQPTGLGPILSPGVNVEDLVFEYALGDFFRSGQILVIPEPCSTSLLATALLSVLPRRRT